MILNGLPVYYSSQCLKTTATPVKKHIPKPWMSEQYHHRIQKKWIKRWGYLKVPAIYQTHNAIIVHPAFKTTLTNQYNKYSGVQNDLP